MTLRTESRAGITLAAAILAGGKARRMGGIAKGNLPACGGSRDGSDCDGGSTIMEHLLREIAAAGIQQKKTIIVANDATPYAEVARVHGVAIIPDLQLDIGPLAGIASALNYYQQRQQYYDALLIVPCDMPNFTEHEISRLMQAYLEMNAPSCVSLEATVCAVPAISSAQIAPIVFAATAISAAPATAEFHPLCAIVNCEILPQLQEIIAAGCRKVTAAWQTIGAKTVLFSEAEDKDKFKNVNNF